eukprot:579799-Rhodomonas_salina.1
MADTLPDGQGELSSGEDAEVGDRAPDDDINTCPPVAVRPGGSAEEGQHGGDGMDSGQLDGTQSPATGADPEERSRTRRVPRQRRRGRREGRSRDSAAEPVEGHDPGQPGQYRTSRQHDLLAACLQGQRKRIEQTTAASQHSFYKCVLRHTQHLRALGIMSAGLEVVAGLTVTSLRAHVGEHLR